ncbi:hypothetical protein ACWD4L_48630, partial [Streptomyces sp. NPDC002596]
MPRIGKGRAGDTSRAAAPPPRPRLAPVPPRCPTAANLVAYSHLRETFGKKIAQHQAVLFRLA